MIMHLFLKKEIRREIISKFTNLNLYDGGLTIMTTLDEDLQLIAEESFRDGLKSYSIQKWLEWTFNEY